MDYWQRRDSRKDSMLKALEASFASSSKALYAEVRRAVEREVEAYLGRYGSDVRGLLDAEGLKSFREEVAHYALLASRMESADSYTARRIEVWRRKLAVLSRRVRVSRLQSLLTAMENALVELGVEQDALLSTALEGFAGDAYLYTGYTIDIERGFSTGLTPIQLSTLVSTKWMGGDFSTRLWRDKDNLLSSLETVFKRGVAMGRNPRRIAGELSNRLGVSYRSCERLCRTEAMHLYNEAAAQSFEEHGISKYRYMTALDERTCEVCGALDGRVFDLKDREEGVNWPVLHPSCRCSCSAYNDLLAEAGAYDGERVARAKDGSLFMVPASMTFEEWKGRYGV